MKTLGISLAAALLMIVASAKMDGSEPETDVALVNDMASELKVLDRLVGTWNDDVTSRATEINPRETKLTGVTTK